MKKFLSLVLALVMAMSLVTISAGAEDFTDDSTITYKEAVDVVSEIGIVDGYTDGSFGPTTTLTRGAAAKIICNLLLGPTTASALSADTAPYSDVPTNHVFAGYISYCANKGIISGYADGTFRPAGTLTGYAFMKMLLGALGYDSEIEGFTGPNWSINVAKTALNIGLDSGNDEFVGTKAVTREEACLYAFNTLKADLVEYDGKTSVVVGDAQVVIGGSEAKAMEWKNSATKKTNIKNDNYVQFAEQYFNKLVKVNVDGDAFARPATRWDYKGVKVGTYAETPDLTYVGDVKLNAIYADLGMSTKDSAANLYVNGLPYSTSTDEKGNVTADTVVVSKANDTKLSADALCGSKVGNGTLVEVYRDDDTNHVDIIVISVYGGKISAVKEATSKKDAYVVVDPGTTYPAGFTTGTHDEFETEAFEEDDIVSYTYSDKDAEIKTMSKLESVEGSLAKRVVGKSLTLGDTTYKYAAEYTFDGITEAGLSNKSDYTVYLDANGYALWIEESEFAVDAYALVLRITSDKTPNVMESNRAELLFSDGTKKIVNLDKDYVNATTGAIAEKDLVRFKVNDDGEYKLTKIVAPNFATGTAAISNKVLKINSVTKNADSKTIFVVQKNAPSTGYDVYTGIKNAPTVTGQGMAYAYLKDGVVKVVFILGGNSENTSKDVTFIAGKSVSKRVTSADTADYYLYNAVVKGEITTVMIEAKDVDSSIKGLIPGEKTNVIWNSLTMDSDDIITSAKFSSNEVTVHTANGVKKVSSEEIKVDTWDPVNKTALSGSVMSVASNCAVYLVDDDGNIEAAEISDVKTNADSVVVYTMEDGEITNLFVQLPKD